VVSKDPPLCNQRSGAATAFNDADSDLAIAEFREPPAPQAEPPQAEPPAPPPQAIEGGSENLAALKILWAQLTEGERRQFLRWTGN
jgi:hypothetical protein